LWSVALLVSIVLTRQVVRKTWILVPLMMAVASPLTPGGVPGRADLLNFILFGLIVLLTTLRFGLLTAFVMQTTERLLTRIPLTLHSDAWYFGLTLVVVGLVSACAIYGFLVSLGGQPAFGPPVAATAGNGRASGAA
jgi:hypothetical protein